MSYCNAPVLLFSLVCGKGRYIYFHPSLPPSLLQAVAFYQALLAQASYDQAFLAGKAVVDAVGEAGPVESQGPPPCPVFFELPTYSQVLLC